MPHRLMRFRRWMFSRFGGTPSPLVGVLRLEGVIAARSGVRGGLSLSVLAERLDDVFALPDLAAVALEINSPGGSPVQSALILDRIRQHARDKDVPVLVFCEDVAASGGYMLALAGDEIYVHEASIIGSIGVVAGGFGFPKLLEKLGVERRLYTAGNRKAMLDPFEEEQPDEVKRLKNLQSSIHDYFIDRVKKRRGKRLKGAPEYLFSGDVFSGTEAVESGLADDIGELRTVMKDRFGKNVRFKRFEEKKPRLGALLGLQNKADISDAAAQTIEERLIWNRFGL